MVAPQNQELFPDFHNPKELRVINDRCLVRTQEGHRVVIVSGIILAQYAVTDKMAEAHAMISLVEQGWADQNDVARVFGYSTRTVRRQQRRFDEGGLAALGRQGGYPTGRPRLATCRLKRIEQLRAAGNSYREIARLMGVSAKAIRKLLRRSGRKDPAPMQPELALGPVASAGPGNPNLSAFCSAAKEALPTSHDTDPSDRGADRLLARLGLLEDAAPLFGSATAVPRAGVLLALPVLVTSGVFECAQKIYGSLGPAFYGLRTSLLTLLLMALWRIKRPEGLKEHSPQDLGRVLGLDRAPEVKTLRRKLARLAAAGTRGAVRPGSGPTTGRLARRGPGLSLHRRPRAGLSRPAYAAQGPRGAHAHLAAGHFGLLGQR